MLRNLHHANLLVGTTAEAELYFQSLCTSLGIQLQNNPNFFAFRMETFGIDEARELRSLSTRKALSSSQMGQREEQASVKMFFITPSYITLEAQNALLKTFEEPFPNTYFFLVLREEALIVRTLHSRMQTLRMQKVQISGKNDAETFLSLAIKDRLLFAKKFADDPLSGGKNLSVFLDDLLFVLRKGTEMRTFLKRVYSIRRNISDSGLASRLVIEHLSLVLP